MAGIQDLTDDQLRALSGGGPSSQPGIQSLSDDQLRALAGARTPAPSEGGVIEDIAKSALAKSAKSAVGMPGIMGDANSGLSYGATWLLAKAAEKMGLLPPGKTADDLAAAAQKIGGPNKGAPGAIAEKLFTLPTSSELQGEVAKAVPGINYEPKTTAGKYAGTVAEFAPYAAVGGTGGLVRRLATGAVAPGLASEAAGQATEGTAAEPWARLAGAVAGGVLPSVAERLITPLPIADTRKAFVKKMEDEGIPLTAGQKTGSKPLQWLESTISDMPLAGGKASEIAADQQQKFTNAALKRIGVNDPEAIASTDVLAKAKKDIGDQFTTLSTRNTLTPDNQLIQDLNAAVAEYNSKTLPTQRSPAVAKQVQDIYALPSMPGASYQAIRSQLGSDAKGLATSDPYQSAALSKVQKALDDAMNRSITPQDATAWAEARRQYGDWKMLEKAAGGAGAASAEGFLSPALVRSAAKTNNLGKYVTGNSDLGELSRAAAVTMSPLPNSGTAPRQNMQHLLQLMGTMGGGAAAGPGGMGAGFLASVAAPAAGGRALMSPLVQKYLANQLLTKGAMSGDARRQALINLLSTRDRFLPSQAN